MPSVTTVLTREPIINKKRVITANRLIVHAKNIPEAVKALDGIIEAWPTQHPVFVSLARLIPTPEILEWIPPENVMLEIPTQALAHPKTQELLPKLAEANIETCLSWYTDSSPVPPELHWRFVIVDTRKSKTPGSANGVPLAWGVRDIEGFNAAIKQNGFEGASGWFFLKNTMVEKELSPSHAQIVRLLNLVRNNAEVNEIEKLLKQDVAISYRLLHYINSAGFGLMCEIHSFRHAVSILGYTALNKWLSLLLVSASRNADSAALIQASIARGRFMEEVGKTFFEKNEIDNLFITGAFSLLPPLLGATMQSILNEMNLPEAVADALLYEQGPYSPFLALAKRCESFDPAPLRQSMDELHVAPDLLNRALLLSVAFADSLTA